MPEDLTMEEFADACGYLVKPDDMEPVREDYVLVNRFTLSNDEYLDRTPRFIPKDQADESTAPGSLITWVEVASDDGGLEFWMQRAGSEPEWLFGFGYEPGVDWLFTGLARAIYHKHVREFGDVPATPEEGEQWLLDEIGRSNERIARAILDEKEEDDG